MSKGLETWKLVRKHIDYISSFWLKEQRHIENVEGHPLDVIEKELNALEIIRKKILCITSDDFFEEIIGFQTDKKLTEEEYNLLKEVLI